ncbi:unnamed protein product [Caenorhabditis angaria]|uniref:Large ribosomal subunit protein bL32m n=1 Tax=Caenorhabditis angaria TaxID=860376 RepID=A0A9P1IJ50_9PELO|nr:unnamed protein product [Caenorhabditis angaria]
MLEKLLWILGRRPPLDFALATVPQAAVARPRITYESVKEMIEDFSVVLGVPKYRTSKPKKVTRKFSFSRLLQPIDNLVTCPSCSNIHPSDSICDKCYEKVRSVTNEIKKKMMEYNPYVGDKQDKEIFVKFKGEEIEKDEVVNGKRVIELEKRATELV